MKKKLCIILRSAYPSCEHYGLLNKEVDLDSITVKETLSDYDIIEIIIPVLTKLSSISDRINFVLATIEKTYEKCHIVINTHGSPGRSDLPDVAVKEVVQQLSQLNTSITQISALQCNGMLPLSPKLPIDSLKLTSSALRTRKSSLGMLQQKLQHMKTHTPMTFEIRGCIEAYDPEIDKALVVGILNGDKGISLPVCTMEHKPASVDTYLHILKSIDIINKTPPLLRGKSEEYKKATNVLGILLNNMKKNIYNFLNQLSALSPENTPLLHSLQAYAESLGLNLEFNNFKHLYNQWIKKHKIFSEERISVFKKYCDFCLLSLQPLKGTEDTPCKMEVSPSCSSHSFFNAEPHQEQAPSTLIFTDLSL